jgi:hypothetical protein
MVPVPHLFPGTYSLGHHRGLDGPTQQVHDDGALCVRPLRASEEAPDALLLRVSPPRAGEFLLKERVVLRALLLAFKQLHVAL